MTHQAADSFLFDSNAMRRLELDLIYAAHSDARVLISSDDAGAKQLVANLIHRHGLRWHRPFLPASCVDVSQHPSLLRAVSGGSLFVHDVEDMTRAMQSEFLHVIEEAAQQNVRLLSATSADIYDRVRSEQFSSELFYRLNTVHLVLPDTPLSFPILGGDARDTGNDARLG